MKYLLALAMAAWSPIANASPGQPYFVRQQSSSVSVLSPTNIPGLAYWWVWTDAATNDSNVDTWTDRIQGLQSKFPATTSRTRPVGRTNGLEFIASSSLSNTPTVFSSNWTFAVIAKVKGGNGIIQNLIQWPPYGSSGGIGTGTTTNWVGIIDGGGVKVASSTVYPFNFHSVIFSFYGSAGVATKTNRVFTNGVYSASMSVSAYTGRTNTAFGVAPSGTYFGDGFIGLVKEVAIWTNYFDLTNVAYFEQYRTNTYGP